MSKRKHSRYFVTLSSAPESLSIIHLIIVPGYNSQLQNSFFTLHPTFLPYLCPPDVILRIKALNIEKKLMDPVVTPSCCNTILYRTPEQYSCIGLDNCRIRAPNTYFFNKEEEIKVCAECFAGFKRLSLPKNQRAGKKKLVGADLEAALEGVEIITIDRNDYEVASFEAKSIQCVPEPTAQCSKCRFHFHLACEKYIPGASAGGFVCSNCEPSNGTLVKCASDLPTTRLTKFMEDGVRELLRTRPPFEAKAESTVIVRELHSSVEKFAAMPHMARFYPESDLTRGFDYVVRAIFAFKKIDEEDVVFFGMRVLEFDHNAPPAIRNSTAIDYLDTVRVGAHTPTTSLLYRQLMKSYWSFLNSFGFVGKHVWANAPMEGDSFIFFSHPPSQRFLTQPLLEQYYINLIESAKEDGIVQEYQTLGEFRTAATTAYDLPYIPDGMFPESLERTIAAAFPFKKKKPTENALMNHMRTFLKNSESRYFFVDCRHRSTTKKTVFQVHHNSVFIKHRDTFIEAAFQNGWEFSSDRHAKYATKCLLHIVWKEHDKKEKKTTSPKKRPLKNSTNDQKKMVRRQDN